MTSHWASLTLEDDQEGGKCQLVTFFHLIAARWEWRYSSTLDPRALAHWGNLSMAPISMEQEGWGRRSIQQVKWCLQTPPISLSFCSTFCTFYFILYLLSGPLADPGLPFMEQIDCRYSPEFWQKGKAAFSNSSQHFLTSYWFWLHYKHIPDQLLWPGGWICWLAQAKWTYPWSW